MIPPETYLSRFPPSFDGNPWSYGFALFSLTLICALALGMLLHFVFEARARRAAERQLYVWRDKPLPFGHPLQIHRLIVTCFLFTVLFGGFPDVLVLYAWGEASESTMETLFLADRIGDGLTFIPFVSAVALSAWGGQTLPQQLIRGAAVPIRRPTWRTFKDQGKIIAMVLLIAAGVTLAKATSGA